MFAVTDGRTRRCSDCRDAFLVPAQSVSRGASPPRPDSGGRVSAPVAQHEDAQLPCPSAGYPRPPVRQVGLSPASVGYSARHAQPNWVFRNGKFVRPQASGEAVSATSATSGTHINPQAPSSSHQPHSRRHTSDGPYAGYIPAGTGPDTYAPASNQKQTSLSEEDQQALQAVADFNLLFGSSC